LLDKVSEMRSAPASKEAETWAPQVHAHAIELEKRAQQALAAADAPAADIFAGGALAAHEHAWVLARLARAERRQLAAQAELDEQRRALAELQTQEQRLRAEAADLELRARVVKNALPLAAHEAASPERIEARRKAAAALATQGRLLCVAARMLGEADAIKEPLARLDELDRELEAGKGSRALETATELRSQCLRVISGVRRQQSRASEPARNVAGPPVVGSAPTDPVPADLVLAELSAAGQSPARDERGVAVVLRDVFGTDGSLSAAGRAQLQRLGETAKAHPNFPLLLVGHTSGSAARPAMDRQLATLTSELQGLGIERVAAHDAGARQPLLPPQLPHARERNQRIELVFVAPGL
jgi:outer membrane protein OmpA-like peptidoglycan-associated protein